MNKINVKRFLCVFSIFLLINSAAVTAQQVYEPPYAKWGRLAMQKTKERYPRADIVDYLHIGRDRITPNTAVEKFKLWLHEGSREFGVFVYIEFELNSDKLINITFRETDR